MSNYIGGGVGAMISVFGALNGHKTQKLAFPRTWLLASPGWLDFIVIVDLPTMMCKRATHCSRWGSATTHTHTHSDCWERGKLTC